jgi:hypothetical protein
MRPLRQHDTELEDVFPPPPRPHAPPIVQAPPPGLRPLTPPRRQIRTGVVPVSAISVAFRVGVQLLAVGLILLSCVGTLYGLAGQSVVVDGAFVIPDVTPVAVGVAFLAQSMVSLAQWGARAWAHQSRDWRWLLLYAAALCVSVYWNWIAYGDLIQSWNPPAGIPMGIALLIIALGDLLPEQVLGQWS